MDDGEKRGELRISNPMGSMWTLLMWTGEFWEMLPVSFHSRDRLLRWAVDRRLYGRIIGDKEFTPWTVNGVTFQNKTDGYTLYTVCNGETVVAINDATCHSAPWPAPGVPSIGKGD